LTSSSSRRKSGIWFFLGKIKNTLGATVRSKLLDFLKDFVPGNCKTGLDVTNDDSYEF